MKKVENVPCMYVLKDKQGKPLYAGHSSICRHRLGSYHEKDDFKAHPTKKRLRKKAKCARVKYMALDEARQHEKAIKRDLPFNFK